MSIATLQEEEPEDDEAGFLMTESRYLWEQHFFVECEGLSSDLESHSVTSLPATQVFTGFGLRK